MALNTPEDAPSWRELWAVEMRDRRWLWQANAGLALWFILDRLAALL